MEATRKAKKLPSKLHRRFRSIVPFTRRCLALFYLLRSPGARITRFENGQVELNVADETERECFRMLGMDDPLKRTRERFWSETGRDGRNDALQQVQNVCLRRVRNRAGKKEGELIRLFEVSLEVTNSPFMQMLFRGRYLNQLALELAQYFLTIVISLLPEDGRAHVVHFKSRTAVPLTDIGVESLICQLRALYFQWKKSAKSEELVPHFAAYTFPPKTELASTEEETREVQQQTEDGFYSELVPLFPR